MQSKCALSAALWICHIKKRDAKREFLPNETSPAVAMVTIVWIGLGASKNCNRRCYTTARSQNDGRLVNAVARVNVGAAVDEGANCGGGTVAGSCMHELQNE
jgi:hypothetical protein